ncbi:chymotrypsinogen A-like [Palaemon carinicauda]|uniref:chymotrypsinogen A-like n=1 Tax=Palaemon carinicauda TaxID=392227 RepID=UPI0035B6ABC1
MATSRGSSLAGILIVSTFWTSALMEGSRASGQSKELESNLEGSASMTKSGKEDTIGLRAEVGLRCEENPLPYALSPGDIFRFKSPRFPRRYPRNTDCGWLLTGSNVVVECDDFRMQHHKQGVCLDYLSLNGVKFCGRYERRPISQALSGPFISIQFHSDRIWNRRGFSCHAAAVVDSDSTPICSCGKSNKRTRIIGGTATGKNEYPWQVAIVWPGIDDFQDFYCGGSIINKRWVLTAAQCNVISEDQVIVGLHSWGSPPATRRRVDIEAVVTHEQFNRETKENDIALLRLAEDLNFSDLSVAPVCLPFPGTTETFADIKATATGWGVLEYGTSVFPSELQEVEVDVVNNSVCMEAYGKFHTITDNMLCAGAEGGGKDTCEGDSGGPLVTEINGAFTQIGIASSGIGCGSEDFFGVYTRVTRYMNWIASKVGTDGLCHHP